MLLDRIHDQCVTLLSLFVMGLCVADLARPRGGSRSRSVALLVLAALTLRSIDLGVALTAVGLGLLVAVPALILRFPQRQSWYVAALILALVFAVGVTYSDHPSPAFLATLAIAITLRAPRPSFPMPPPPSAWAAAVVAAVVLLAIYDGTDNLWAWVYFKVPGGSAIRAPGRVILVLLVPAAIGLAALLATPAFRHRPWLAYSLAALLIAEQAVRTPTTDGADDRARVAALAHRVNPSYSAFYHNPGGPVPRSEVYQVDAMYAALEAGVPTVNGYSGGCPRAWASLVLTDSPRGLPPRDALREWLDTYEIPTSHIQILIDAPPWEPSTPSR